MPIIIRRGRGLKRAATQTHGGFAYREVTECREATRRNHCTWQLGLKGQLSRPVMRKHILRLHSELSEAGVGKLPDNLWEMDGRELRATLRELVLKKEKQAARA